MEPKLIKIDKNGSKHYEGLITCDRCGGSGIYAHHVENGHIVPNWNYDGVCLKCEGKGKVFRHWIERTPEYQAELDAKREAKHKAQHEKYEAEKAAREAELARIKAEKEAELKAKKAVSQYVGSVGDKVTLKLTHSHTASYSFNVGWMEQTMFIHMMKDENGNTFIWKTANGLGMVTDKGYKVAEEGAVVTIKGTIKEHSEYKDEKQTVLTRCKVIDVYNGAEEEPKQYTGEVEEALDMFYQAM